MTYTLCTTNLPNSASAPLSLDSVLPANPSTSPSSGLQTLQICANIRQTAAHLLHRLPKDIIISTTGSPTTFDKMKGRLVDRMDEADGLIRWFSLIISDHPVGNSPAEVDWMGKHFRMTTAISGEKISRCYSCLFACIREIGGLHQQGRWA